ncbi:uncharacterized protein LOC132195750 [Neocloeon triangulifer]|uniref:uncharacterized protein LOC132195750 n=1 Tax=Neocloeon triangulifer TaxID=2078957 RepID=UPI00286EEF8F|nr:uncharacterized protein LOC132195750 [Neocloeon triangulifer]
MSEAAQEADGGGTGSRLGCRTPYRQLSSQIVSKDEIAEEIANRFKKSAADTTRPFVDKRVLQEALLALKFDAQFVRKIDPSNEDFLRTHADKRKGEGAAVEGENGGGRPGHRLDPKLEKELALKQLSELPTLKRRKKNDAAPEQPPAPSVFNEKVLQNLKRSVQRSARHSALLLKPQDLQSALERLGAPVGLEGPADALEAAPEEACLFRPTASRIIRRHSTSDDDSDPDDPKPPSPLAGATEASAEATTPAETGAEPEEGKVEGVRVMRSRVQRTYPSKRRPPTASGGGDDGRRTYLSPVMKKQLGRL